LLKDAYGDWYVMAVNQRANVRFFEMYEHPELQWKLLAANGIGQTARHNWVKGPAAEHGQADRFYTALLAHGE
jgi:hypothetical protein